MRFFGNSSRMRFASTLLAVAELDLAEYVTSPAEGAARPRQIVKQVLLSPG